MNTLSDSISATLHCQRRRLAWICEPNISIVVYSNVINAVEVIAKIIVEQGHGLVSQWISGCNAGAFFDASNTIVST